MDAIVGVVTMAFVEPILLSLLSSELGGCMERKAYLSLFKFRFGAFEHNTFS